MDRDQIDGFAIDAVEDTAVPLPQFAVRLAVIFRDIAT
jgi:hypothetical protein